MPHSGGGGSSSSGSHSSSSSSSYSSSSHHSGGGGSSSSGPIIHPSRRISHTEYRPSNHDTVYVRYRDGKPQFRYAGNRERRKTSKKTIIITSLLPVILAPLMVAILFTLFGHMSVATKDTAAPVTEPYAGAEWQMIDDQADSFTPSEEQEIEKALDDLYMSSGIRTEVQTITQETFEEAGESDLETYAYAEYVNLFPDEDHFLIVFEDKGNNAWDFELMEGDNTWEWLTDETNIHFNETLTKNLWATSRYTYGTAFSAALTDLNTYMQEHAGESIENMLFEKAAADFSRALCFIAMFFIAIFGLFRMKARLQAGSVDQQMAEDGYTKITHPTIVMNRYGHPVPKMIKCDYCGGLYPAGSTVCPHCGAPAKNKIVNNKGGV